MIAEALGLDSAAPQSRGGLVLASEETRVGAIEVAHGQVEGFRQEVVVLRDGRERVNLAWSGLAGIATSANEEPKSVELHLVGGDGTEIAVRVATPLDPYPGTAARMVHAVGGLTGLAPGLHATTALPASN